MRRLITTALAVIFLTTTMVQPVAANVYIDRQTNRFRVSRDLHRLRTSKQLWRVARTRVKQIAQPGGFHHPFDWGRLLGRLPSCVSGVGENIAYYSIGHEPKGFPVSAWKRSRPHRENMLGRWRWHASAVFKARGYTWYVQLFARGCRQRSTL
jgi:uncharacterized protein YkwD